MLDGADLEESVLRWAAGGPKLSSDHVEEERNDGGPEFGLRYERDLSQRIDEQWSELAVSPLFT